MPLWLKPAPVAFTLEMVILVVAEFVRVTVFVLLLPTVTTPNDTLPGLMLNVEPAAALACGLTITAANTAAMVNIQMLIIDLCDDRISSLPAHLELPQRTRLNRGL